MVLYPASDFLLRCQKKYAMWYGERPCDGRSLEVKSLAEVALDVAKRKKPRLGYMKTASAASEEAMIRAHSDSVQAAIAAVQAGAGETTTTVLGHRLGASSSPQASPGDMVSDMAQEAWTMRKKRKEAQTSLAAGSQPDLQFYGQSAATGAASSQSLPSTPSGMRALLSGIAQEPQSSEPIDSQWDWSVAAQAVAKQRQVAETRAQAQMLATAGKPAEFVDSKGGHMVPKPEGSTLHSTPGPEIPFRPSVLICKGAGTLKDVLPKPYVATAFPGKADIILVPQTTSSSAATLLARLDGARLLDLQGRLLHFKGSLQKQHMNLFVQDCFARHYPHHVQALEQCAIRSPRFKRQQEMVPRLTVERGPMPTEPRWPTKTFQLVASLSVAADSKNCVGP